MKNLTSLTPSEEKILKLLKTSQEALSGEKLAQALGLSRVAIWKKIKKLKEKKYPLLTTKKGYILQNKDLFLKEELDEVITSSSLVDEIVYFLETSSTMDIAKDLADRGKRALIIAEKQLQGRGRLGRSWESAEGGLWFTLILMEALPLKRVFLLTYLSALATALAIKDTFNLLATVKWPNDVLIEGKKVAGILLEIKAEVDQLLYALIGIGINVNNAVLNKEFLHPATSISEELQKKVSRLPLLKNFLIHFERLLQEPEQILPLWKERSETLGKWVKIVTQKDTIVGKAVDIDEEGALMVITESGEVKRVFSGDCFHLRNVSL